MVQGPWKKVLKERERIVLRGKENEHLEKNPEIANSIKFGSLEGEPTKEGNEILDFSVLNEDWPPLKQIHSFYFVKFRPYEDPNIKSGVDQLDIEISMQNKTRSKLTEAIEERFEMVQDPLEKGAEGQKVVLLEKENGHLEKDPEVAKSIKFGSLEDKPTKEGSKMLDFSARNKDFVKFQPYEDPNIKSGVNKLDIEISMQNKTQFELTEAIKARFEMVQDTLEKGAEGEKAVFPGKENGYLEKDPEVAESIKFGSLEDKPTKEGSEILDSSARNEDFVKFRSYEDPNIKSRVDQLDIEISLQDKTRFELTEAIKARFEMVQDPLEKGAEGEKVVLPGNKNGHLEKDPAEFIKFGLLENEPNKEGSEILDSSARNEDWPAPKQIHSFYFVKFWPYEDPNIKSRVDQLDREISMQNKTQFELTEAIKAKRSDRAELISQIKALRDQNRQFQYILDEKRKEIEPLTQALGKLRTPNSSGWGGLCSSEKELNDIIYSLQYRIQHETIPLSEEKQLLHEIKQLEGTREKVIANASMKAKLQDSLGQKEAIQDQVKLIGGDLDGVKKEREIVRSKIMEVDHSLKVLDMDIQSLQDKLTGLIQKKDKAYESILQLRKQRNEGNSCFYQSRALLNKARELAAKKDVKALEELSQAEVEKFMSLWSSDIAFRNDYERRILPSLDNRQLSRDGRIRNSDEKPLMEESKPDETHIMPKISKSQLKEEPESSPKDSLPSQKLQNEAKNKERDLKSHLENKELAEVDKLEFEKPKKENVVKEPEIDPAKLKEMKREEQIAKMKLALERKAKLARKAAAKAAVRAQKEAEKKLKEREKKAEKKAKKAAAASAPDPNPEEQPANVAVEATEPEKLDENDDAPVAVKEKVQKESSVRSRGGNKGRASVPKVVLKKKRSQNYWLWAASAALLLLLLVLLGYYYLY